MRTAKQKKSAQIYSPIYVNFVHFVVQKALNVGLMFLQSKISNTLGQRCVLKADGHPHDHIFCLLWGSTIYVSRSSDPINLEAACKIL
jgi:hypothetical protein